MPSNTRGGGGNPAGGSGLMNILFGGLTAINPGFAGNMARGYVAQKEADAKMAFEQDLTQRRAMLAMVGELINNPNVDPAHKAALADYGMQVTNTPVGKKLPSFDKAALAAIKGPQLASIPAPPLSVVGNPAAVAPLPQGVTVPPPPPGQPPVVTGPGGPTMSGVHPIAPPPVGAPPPKEYGPAGQLHFASPQEQEERQALELQSLREQGLLPPNADKYMNVAPGGQIVDVTTGKVVAKNEERKPSNRPDYEPELVSGSVVGVRDNKTNRLLSPEEANKNPEAKKVLDMAQKGAAEGEQRTEAKESRAFSRAISMADVREQQRLRTEARKAVTGVETQYKQDETRLNLMEKAQKEANAGNAQADMALISNHLGMTMGLQKGARITQTVWNEAMRTRPWLQSLKVTFVGGLMTGAKLSPEQREQMVELARDRVSESGRSVTDSYQQYGDQLKGHQRIQPRSIGAGTGAGAPRPAYQVNGVWFDAVTGQPIGGH